MLIELEWGSAPEHCGALDAPVQPAHTDRALCGLTKDVEIDRIRFAGRRPIVRAGRQAWPGPVDRLAVARKPGA